MMLSEAELNRLVDELINKMIARRKELGLSQRDLAERIGVPQSTIGRIESKATNPRMDTFDMICKALDLKPVLTKRVDA